MQFEAEYIDWNRAQQLVHDVGVEALVAAMKKSGGAPGLCECATDELGDSHILAWEVGETGLVLANFLDSEAADAMRAIVAVIGPGGEHTALFRDLPFDGDELTFSMMSPQRAGEIASKFDLLDMKSLRRAFEAIGPLEDNQAILTFADFEENLLIWRGILRNAAESGRGLRFMLY